MSPGNVRRTRGLTALATATAAGVVVMVPVTTAGAAQQLAAGPTGGSAGGTTATSPSVHYPPITAVAPTVFDNGQIV